MRHALGVLCLITMLITSAVSAAPPAQEANTLQLAMPEPDTLDPAQISRFNPPARDLIENLFVGLTRFNPTTQQIEPALAKSWTVSDDGLTWTFTIREDAQWVRYDPAAQEIVAVRPVAAGDFVYAVQRACDPLRPSPVTPNVMIVQGCLTLTNAFPEVIDDLFIAREMGIRAIGPHTLEINLMFPAVYFPTLLSMPDFRPLPREAVTATERWTQAPTLMTTGPYALVEWNANGMTLAHNPHWPDAVAGNVDRIEVSFTTESFTATALTRNGQVDFARLPPDEIPSAQNSLPSLLKSTAGSTLTMIGFSTDRALVELPEVRRALSLAIDRAALVQQFFPGQARAVSQFTPPGVVAAPTFDNTLYNPAHAQAQYSLAGYEGCQGVPEKMILLVPEEDPIWVEIGNAIIQQWATALGCSPTLFEVRTVSRTLLIELAHANYDPEQVTRSHIWLVTWNADYLDANAWINDALHCRYGFIRNGRLCGLGDELMDRATLEEDTAARAQYYADAEAYFFGLDGAFPVAPLFISTSAWLQQSWLTGVNEYGPARFDLWSIERE